MRGLPVCWMHGGKSRQALKARDERLAMAEARELLGIPIDVDPAEALLQQVHIAAGNEVFLRSQVQELGIDITRPAVLGDGVDVHVKLWNEEREKLVRFSKVAIDAGIAERSVRIKEVEAAVMVAVFIEVFDDPSLQLSSQQRAVARQLARAALLRQGNAQGPAKLVSAGRPDADLPVVPGLDRAAPETES